jgi:hypothetical protein
MSIVLTPAVLDQDTDQEAIKGLALLLAFVDAEWKIYEGSPARTMRSLMRIPPDIQRIVVRGVVYYLTGRRREIWFRRSDDGYNGNRFYVPNAVDAKGHSWQLELDRSGGVGSDDLVLICAKRL